MTNSHRQTQCLAFIISTSLPARNHVCYMPERGIFPPLPITSSSLHSQSTCLYTSHPWWINNQDFHLPSPSSSLWSLLMINSHKQTKYLVFMIRSSTQSSAIYVKCQREEFSLPAAAMTGFFFSLALHVYVPPIHGESTTRYSIPHPFFLIIVQTQINKLISLALHVYITSHSWWINNPRLYVTTPSS